MHFVKVHGTGNDFVLLPDLDGRLVLTAALTRALCTPHTGLGADGVIRLAPPREGVDADVFMDYRNADGSVAEMCGNGVRCVAKYVVDRGLAGDGSTEPVVRVDTRGGVKHVEVAERHPDGRVARVRVDMGRPELDEPVEVDVSPQRVVAHAPEGTAQLAVVTAEARRVSLTCVSMGNPHAVAVIDDVLKAPVATWGPVIAADPAFPSGTNVEFIAVPRRDRVEGRIWERGVGETLASGTGASAMAVAAITAGLADEELTVVLPGGELRVDWRGERLAVVGEAVEVAAGALDDAWLTAAPADAAAPARTGGLRSG